MKSMAAEAMLMLRIKGILLFLSLIPTMLRTNPARGNTINGSGCIATSMLSKDL